MLNFLSIFIALASQAQMVSDFENVSLNSNGIYDGSDLAGGFSSQGLFFPNKYDPQFSVWSGFAASQKTDTVTAGYTNQYSTFAGASFSGSKFAVAFASDPVYLRNTESSVSKRLVSFRFTNNSYAGLSMKNGDAFSKKFGGTSGNDPDFFKLKVFNFRGGIKTDSAEFFLADYRFADNSQDYIMKNWKLATTNFTQPFDSLGFQLSSSDNGSFGMNTPAYFCLDDIQVEVQTSVPQTHSAGILLYPNPATDFLILENSGKAIPFGIYQADGKQILERNSSNETQIRIPVSGLKPGCYFLRMEGQPARAFQKL